MKSLSDMNFDWGGSQFYPSYQGYMNTGAVTPPAPAAAPPSSGTTGAPTGTPPTPTPSGVPVASPATGQTPPISTPPTGTAPDPNAANLEVIRKSHELVQRLGGEDKIAPAVERYQKMETTTMDLGVKLGYTKESLEKAFAEDPGAIYSHIIAEASQVAADRRTADQSIPKEVRDLLNRELAPVRNVLQRQMAEEGNRLTDNEFNSQLSAHTLFKGKDVPQAVKDDIYDRFVNYASADKTVQTAILQDKDPSGLKVHFDRAVADFYAAVNAHAAWTGKGTTPGTTPGTTATGAPTPANPNPFNLQDIIDGNDNATAGMASMRNFR